MDAKLMQLVSDAKPGLLLDTVATLTVPSKLEIVQLDACKQVKSSQVRSSKQVLFLLISLLARSLRKDLT